MSRARVPAFHFMAASLVLYLISDAVYGVLELTDVYESGHPVDAGYALLRPARGRRGPQPLRR